MSKKNEILTKELISEEDYNVKLALCSGHALKYAIGSFFVGIVAIPIILKGFKLYRLPIEARLAAGFLSGLPILYYCGKYARDTCMVEVKDTYRFN